MIKKILLLIVIISLNACSDTVEKLRRIGKDPELANIELPTIEADEDELERNKAMQEKQHAYQKRTNSLWQRGSTTFFRDSRAWKAGDIIKVKVQIQDNASLDNSTTQRRSGSSSMGIPALFGKERAIAKTLSPNTDVNKLVSTNSDRNHNGSGNISRSEVVKTEIAATVNKVLPNGNLVIHGHQEIMVNSELREIKIAGIIRPKDIASDNSINTTQMAEARISYGGRGVVSDVQKPKYGSQIVETLSPF